MMKRLAISISTGLAALALSCGLAGTASALPEIHVALGESFPVTGEGSAIGMLIEADSTALSAPATSDEVKVLLLCEKLGSLCGYDWHLVGVKLEGKSCHTAGDAEGVVLVTKDEVHFVSTSTSPLDLAGDWLVAKMTVVCLKGVEELKVTTEGEVLSKIEGVKSGQDVTSFVLNVKCTKPNNGKQELKEYLNSEGKLVKGILKSNLGLGNETACYEIKNPVTVKMNKMVEFTF